MSLVSCPNCSAEISSMAEKCPKCGYELKGESNEKDSNQKKGKAPLIALGIIALAASLISIKYGVNVLSLQAVLGNNDIAYVLTADFGLKYIISFANGSLSLPWLIADLLGTLAPISLIALIAKPPSRRMILLAPLALLAVKYAMCALISLISNNDATSYIVSLIMLCLTAFALWYTQGENVKGVATGVLVCIVFMALMIVIAIVFHVGPAAMQYTMGTLNNIFGDMGTKTYPSYLISNFVAFSAMAVGSYLMLRQDDQQG